MEKLWTPISVYLRINYQDCFYNGKSSGKLSDSNTNLVENHRGASMSEATDQLGSSPPMELRQMGVTKGRKMYLNIGEGR